MPASPRQDQQLPYRYSVTITMDIEGDGIHAHGDGATATLRRLTRLLEGDPRVLRVVAFDPRYMRSFPPSPDETSQDSTR